MSSLLAASSWRRCELVDGSSSRHRNYVRLHTRDQAGVIGRIGSCFGAAGVSIQSIVQFEAREGDGNTDQSGEGPSQDDPGAGPCAEIVVITHEVQESHFRQALAAIENLSEVTTVAACLRTL